ncbi:MAG TPA: SCO family protein [Rhodocyclaceae bacterium]|nr:SCO family protein [Rhodocyclaceae bacterium]
MLRTLLASLLILVAGVATLAAATEGFRVFTAETARRFDIRAHPRALPSLTLQTTNGGSIDLLDLRGRWLLVDFVYTRCMTYCSIQGSEFSRLQQQLAEPIAQGKATLLSLSFDPDHDGPAELESYLQRSGVHGAGWVAARPTDATSLTTMMRFFGVKAISDGMGGFVHNSAIGVIDPRGRLIDVVDWSDPQMAARYLSGRAGS